MIKLNSWLISAWNANVSVSSSPAMMISINSVCVMCVRFVMELKYLHARERVKRPSFRV